MHDDHDTDHSQTDLTTNPKDNTNNGDIDIETDILQLTGEDLESTYPNNRYFGQVHENFEIPAREEQTVPAGDVLPPKIARNLEFDPWSHQAEALQVLDRGDNVCVATSTSSGKTLVYGLHIARQYLEDPETRSLIVSIRRRRSVATKSKNSTSSFVTRLTGYQCRRLRWRHEERGKVSHPR